VQLGQRLTWQRRLPLVVIASWSLWHASRYDFICDDAFIALRYARNLIEHHELSYNLGQRVEGFTSPLWVMLTSAAGALGLQLPSAARLLGAGSALLTFVALCRFWDELEPTAPRLVLVPAAALAMSAPFAAWTMGGLETPLFAATFTLTLALLARDARTRTLRSSLQAGLAAALCVLCRPEGATLVFVGAVAVCLASPESAALRWRRTLVWLAPIALIVGGYQLFRLRYYGYPLPNTFYVKTSGEGLWQRGVTYLAFAAGEFGWTLVVACALSFLYLLLPRSLRFAERALDSSRVLLGSTAVAAGVHLLYLARVGGDFLDLYRFLTPLLPAAFCVMTCAASRLCSRLPERARLPALAVAACLLVLHGANQHALAQRAGQVAESSRAKLHLEPLGWTRLYARRWQGVGGWLARVRAQGDSTAVGAAGALPYYSGLPNLDLFGLNDAEIARNGRVIGNRPGHQRFATMPYLLAQKPTFIFMNPESTPSTSGRLRYDRFWTNHGYVPIEIRVDPELCGCPETFYHQFLVRRDRAATLRGRDGVVVGSALP